MYTKFYTNKKTFVKYDKDHYLLYLNEEAGSNEHDGETIEGFFYTGDFEDGGTMIEAENATYAEFVSGLVRKRYSANQIEAILLNIQSGDTERMQEFEAELAELNAYRDECKLIARNILGIG